MDVTEYTSANYDYLVSEIFNRNLKIQGYFFKKTSSGRYRLGLFNLLIDEDRRRIRVLMMDGMNREYVYYWKKGIFKLLRKKGNKEKEKYFSNNPDEIRACFGNKDAWNGIINKFTREQEERSRKYADSFPYKYRLRF